MADGDCETVSGEEELKLKLKRKPVHLYMCVCDVGVCFYHNPLRFIGGKAETRTKPRSPNKLRRSALVATQPPRGYRE